MHLLVGGCPDFVVYITVKSGQPRKTDRALPLHCRGRNEKRRHEGAVSKLKAPTCRFRSGLVTRVAQVVVYRPPRGTAGNRPPSQLCWVNV